jgi:hypothetical protein
MFSLVWLLSVVRYTIIPKGTSPLPPSKGGGWHSENLKLTPTEEKVYCEMVENTVEK